MVPTDYLHYENNGEMYPIPDWAQFFITLGSQIAHLNHPESVINIAIATPSRAFVSGFLSIGIVVARSGERMDVGESIVSRIKELLRAKGKTEIVVKEGAKRTRCILCEVEERTDGLTRIVVIDLKAKGGPLTRRILPEQCELTNVASGIELISVNQPGPQDTSQPNSFISYFISEQRQGTFNTKSELNFTIIGPLNILRRELKETALSVRPLDVANTRHFPLESDNNLISSKYPKGTLQDILKVKKLSSAYNIYKSDIVPAESRIPTEKTGYHFSDTVIFDGATSFSKWHGMGIGNTRVIVLDKGDSHINDALNIVNQGFMGRESDLGLEDLTVPQGIEIAAYLEAK